MNFHIFGLQKPCKCTKYKSHSSFLQKWCNLGTHLGFFWNHFNAILDVITSTSFFSVVYDTNCMYAHHIFSWEWQIINLSVRMRKLKQLVSSFVYLTKRYRFKIIYYKTYTLNTYLFRSNNNVYLFCIAC